MKQEKKINKSKRKMVGIPEDTLVHDVLYNQNNGIRPKWEILEDILIKMPKSKEERVESYYNEFLEKTTELFPEVKEALETIRPLIIKQIIRRNKSMFGEYEALSDDYYRGLKKL